MSEPASSLVRSSHRPCPEDRRCSDLAVGSELKETKALSHSNEREGLRHPKARKSTIDSNPTLSQAWSRDDPGPQYAFKMSMFNVSCNSH